MAYIRTCVQNLGEIRRPVRNNCPSSLIINFFQGHQGWQYSSQSGWHYHDCRLVIANYNYIVYPPHEMLIKVSLDDF